MKKLLVLLALTTMTAVATAADVAGAFDGAYRGGKVLSVSTYASADKGIESVQLVEWQRPDGRVCHQFVSGAAVMRTAHGDKTAFVTSTRCDGN